MSKGNDLMKKSKKVEDSVTRSAFPVNQNFLNMILPSGIDIDDRGVVLGENIGKLYAISRYPSTVDYGWLAPLCNLDGTSTTVEFHYTDSQNLIDIYNKSISELRSKIDSLKNESERQVANEQIEDLKKLINRLAVKQEPVGYINIMLHIQHWDKEKLEDLIKTVSGKVAVQGCNMKLLTKRQEKALRAIAPYGLPNKDASAIGLRNMPLSTFIGGFPMANPGLNDPEGYYLGKTSNGRVVIVDPWVRGRDRTNSNWLIIGVPGVGKSTALKDILAMEYALGTRIMILDINDEFIDLAMSSDINGDVLYCAGENGGNGTKTVRINPLQARKMAVVTKKDINKNEKKEDYLLFDESASDLEIYIQHLRIFFSLYFGKNEFDAGVRARFEECIIELYEKWGISFETDVSQIPADKWPIIPDLYDVVEEKCEQRDLPEYILTNYLKLKDLLYPAGRGADRLWNGPTTLESDNDFVDLVTSGLMATDEKVKRAQSYNILSWMNEEATKDKKQRVLVGVDEGYMYVDPEYPDIMKYMRNMDKQFRKYEAGFMFITHAVGDILGPEVKLYGQSIVDNACYKFIMGCDGQNLEETRQLLGLSDGEVKLISQKERAQGIFIVGNTRMKLVVDVCDEILAMMGDAGGR